MVQVHRSGSIVSIPRKLSHHVPIVPIIDSQEFEHKLKVHYDDFESEDFQFYKTASVDEHKLINKVEVQVVGRDDKKKKSDQLSAVEAKVIELLQGKLGSADEIISILKVCAG